VLWWIWIAWLVTTVPVALGHPRGISVHLQHSERAQNLSRYPTAELPSAPTPGPDHTVYGYLAFWADDMETVPWDHLSHLALFAANAHPDGTLSRSERWGDVAQALNYGETYDVGIHLTIVNFDTAELRAFLGDVDARHRLIATLEETVEQTGVDGVNIDFEGVPADRREEMVSFIRDLSMVVDEVVVATPAVDWSDAWAFAELTRYADLFIMGYGYHWSGSTYAGPVDPLYGGTPWGVHSLDWTAEQYLASGADPERVIMGLPLYGSHWPVANNTVPALNQGAGTAVFWADAHREAAIHGLSMEPKSYTPYFFDGSGQTWFGTAQSVQARVHRMLEQGLGGVGFWALNYDEGDAALWAGVYEETHSESLDAELVLEFDEVTLAYVGTEASVSVTVLGPERLQYSWTQKRGPRVTLQGGDSERAGFALSEEGIYEFMVEVWVEGTTPQTASMFVVGISKDELSPMNCGCHLGSAAMSIPSLGLIVLSMAWTRRRNGSV